MSLKLISFTICPYVQRAVLTLNEHNTDFDVEYIDLANKPQWFLDISPRGKVPVLVVDDKDALFESQAIAEYLDETAGGDKLTPQKAIERARDRAWFGMSSEDLLTPLYMMETTDSQDVLDANRKKLRTGLERIATALEGRQFLSGDGSRFGLADVGAAPVLYRMAVLPEQERSGLLDGLSGVAAWMERVLAKDTVKKSVPDSWAADHTAYCKRMGAILAQ